MLVIINAPLLAGTSGLALNIRIETQETLATVNPEDDASEEEEAIKTTSQQPSHFPSVPYAQQGNQNTSALYVEFLTVVWRAVEPIRKLATRKVPQRRTRQQGIKQHRLTTLPRASTCRMFQAALPDPQITQDRLRETSMNMMTLTTVGR